MTSPSRSDYVTLNASDGTTEVYLGLDTSRIEPEVAVRSEERESLKAPLMQDLKANYNTFYGSSPVYSGQCDIFAFEGQTHTHCSQGPDVAEDNPDPSQALTDQDNGDPRLSPSNHMGFRRGVYGHLKQLWALVPPVWRGYGKAGAIKATASYSDI